MIRSNCGTENTAGAKFCGECATRLASICPSCGTSNGPAAKFCSECATPLGVAASGPQVTLAARSRIQAAVGEALVTEARAIFEGVRAAPYLAWLDAASDTQPPARPATTPSTRDEVAHPAS